MKPSPTVPVLGPGPRFHPIQSNQESWERVPAAASPFYRDWEHLRVLPSYKASKQQV